MAISLTERVSRIQPSATIAVSVRAAELRAAGRDVIGLGAGEPDFDTPDHIKQAAWEAIQRGETKYTAVDGIKELKEAVQAKFKRDHDLDYALDEIMVSAGAKHTLMNILISVIEEGDEVLIPCPYWASYGDMTRLVDGEPKLVKCGLEQHFKITPDQLRDNLNAKTKIVLLNAPNNPTGQVYTQTEWRALANVLNDYPDVLVVTDEIYEHIYWGEEPYCSFLMACPEFKNRTVVINGISKAYAMTGWRIGYSAGPKHVIATMKKVQSQMTSSCCAISQWASVAALNGDQSCIEPMREAFKLRHDMVLGRINAMPGVTCLPADGAFYAFADFSQVIAKIDGVEDDTQLCEWLLEKADVALVPGAAFGMPGYARISYATDMDSLNEAMDRLDRVLPE